MTKGPSTIPGRRLRPACLHRGGAESSSILLPIERAEWERRRDRNLASRTAVGAARARRVALAEYRKEKSEHYSPSLVQVKASSRALVRGEKAMEYLLC
jgi:hypothetical protein